MPDLPAGTGGDLLVIGANHRTSPLAWRERFAFLEANLVAELDRLRERGFAEAVLLATCDRIELLTVAADAGALRGRFAHYLAERLGEPAERVEAAFYTHSGAEALKHVFAVASALDSLVIGEPHVLGQLRAAHRAAGEAGLLGVSLEQMLQAAYAAARRVRRETRIAERPVSIAAAAVELAREIHGDLDRVTALLLGTTEMGELIAEQFRNAGVKRLLIAGAEPVAGRLGQSLGATVLPLTGLEAALPEADIVIAAMESGRRALTAAMTEAALRRRRRRPVFVIDAAIPPAVENGVNALNGAFLYTLDDLEGAAMAGRAWRAAAAGEAWTVLEAELAAFDRRRAERGAVPAVSALRGHFETMREAILRDEPGLDAEAATRLLVNRLLHAPSEVLRGSAAAGDPAAMEALVRRLFRLEDPEGDESP